MSEKDVRPKALAQYMEKRNQRFAAMSQTARRVKIEQNHTWRIRLLPVTMGPDKEPFVDIAQHWWNKQPITCPRHTTQAWGGDPEYPCPVCELAERLRESASEEINGIGYKARCNLRVRAWCIVFDMEDTKGDVDDMPLSEILNPYEFDMYKTTWESFAKYQKWAMSGRRGGKEASEFGLLDLESGCDLLATQGAKGVTLDRCDPGPIFPADDPNFDSYIQKIWNRVHKPQITIPAEKDLLDVASKIEEYAERGGSGSRRRGRDEEDDRGRGRFGGRGRSRDDDPDEGVRGGSGSSRRSRYAEDQDTDAPAKSSRRERAPEAEESPAPRRRAPEPEAQEEAPAPRRRAAEPEAQDEAPRRSSAPAGRRAAEPEPEAQEETPAAPTRRSNGSAQSRRAAEPEEPAAQEEAAEEQNPDPAPPPPARRGASPGAPAAARRSAPDSGDADTTPQRPPTRRSAAAPPAAGVDEDEDNAPEERRDPAPASRERVEDAPPEVSESGPAPKRQVGDSADIKARLDKLNARGR